MVWPLAGAESKAVDVNVTAAAPSVGKAQLAAIKTKDDKAKRTTFSSTVATLQGVPVKFQPGNLLHPPNE
jgi:hypothetical protein